MESKEGTLSLGHSSILSIFVLVELLGIYDLFLLVASQIACSNAFYHSDKTFCVELIRLVTTNMVTHLSGDNWKVVDSSLGVNSACLSLLNQFAACSAPYPIVHFFGRQPLLCRSDEPCVRD